MRYSTKPRFRKYVERYDFLSFARKFGDKYGKELKYTATKTGIHAARTASKRVVQKIAETTGGLIGYKIADKITSLGKPNPGNNLRNNHIFFSSFFGYKQT